MTAIAYKSGVLAADTLTTGGDMVRGQTSKIARSPTGMIGAAAGPASLAERFREWLTSGQLDVWLGDPFRDQLVPITVEGGGFGAILITPAGEVILVDWRGYPIKGLHAPFYTEGSAEQILCGAMAAGASAEEAVRIAIQYDVGSGGEVQTATINAPLVPREDHQQERPPENMRRVPRRVPGGTTGQRPWSFPGS